MSDWGAVAGGNASESAGQVLTTTAGTVVAAAVATNTKGNYVQLISATSYAWAGFWVYGWNGPPAFDNILLDVGIGAALAEQVVAGDIMFGGEYGCFAAFIPVSIPAGTRVAARIQSSVGGANTVSVALVGVPEAIRTVPPLGRVTSYGVSTTTSTGTSLDGGATANTKGAWTQLVLSTANPMRALSLVVSHSTGTANAARFLVDVAIGPDASAQVILSNVPVTVPAGASILTPAHGPIPVTIPAGTRLIARVSCSVESAADRVLRASVLGFD